MKDNLLNGTVINAVNMPNVDPKTLAEIGPFLRFGLIIGRLISQIAPPRADFVGVNYSGNLGEMDTTLVSRGVLKGYLERALGADQVNLINAVGSAKILVSASPRAASRAPRSSRTLLRSRSAMAITPP